MLHGQQRCDNASSAWLATDHWLLRGTTTLPPIEATISLQSENKGGLLDRAPDLEPQRRRI